MANSTPNYALVKPAYNEWADITVLNNNLDIIDTQIFAKASKTRQIIAGLGLTGGGDLTTDRTLNIVSANDGIIVNPDNIQLNTIDNLTTASSTKPLSANMGKVLQDTKLNLTGGIVTNGTDEALIGVSYNNLSTDMMYMYTNATNTGIYNNIPTHGNISIFSRSKSTGVVTYAGGTFNGDITAPNLAYDTTQIIAGTGLTGGGDISASRTLNIVSANDGITSNADNIQLNTIDNLTTASSTKPLSANMGKVLQDTKLNLTGGTLTGALNAPNIVASNGTSSAIVYAIYNNLATDQMYMYNNSTSQGMYSNLPIGEIGIFSRNKSTGTVTFAGGNYGTINGTTATFSGAVTAPSITIGGYVVTIV